MQVKAQFFKSIYQSFNLNQSDSSSIFSIPTSIHRRIQALTAKKSQGQSKFSVKSLFMLRNKSHIISPQNPHSAYQINQMIGNFNRTVAKIPIKRLENALNFTKLDELNNVENRWDQTSNCLKKAIYIGDYYVIFSIHSFSISWTKISDTNLNQEKIISLSFFNSWHLANSKRSSFTKLFQNCFELKDNSELSFNEDKLYRLNNNFPKKFKNSDLPFYLLIEDSKTKTKFLYRVLVKYPSVSFYAQNETFSYTQKLTKNEYKKLMLLGKKDWQLIIQEFSNKLITKELLEKFANLERENKSIPTCDFLKDFIASLNESTSLYGLYKKEGFTVSLKLKFKLHRQFIFKITDPNKVQARFKATNFQSKHLTIISMYYDISKIAIQRYAHFKRAFNLDFSRSELYLLNISKLKLIESKNTNQFLKSKTNSILNLNGEEFKGEIE